MIRTPARELPPDARTALERYQREIDAEPDFGKRVEAAAAKFRQRNRPGNATFSRVRHTLTTMCSGASRCMYCEDSAADEVEHHRPKNLYPEQVFVWENYLYACGPCNGPKKNRFAVFAPDGSIADITRKPGEPIGPPSAGDPVLIHPRVENPLDYMMLDLRDTFAFVPIAAPDSKEFLRASYTIELLRLNKRDDLKRARREAYENYRARLVEFIHGRDDGADRTVLGRLTAAIARISHPTVWFEMRRQRHWIPELAQLFDQAPEALTWK